ncbi:MAG: DUF4846 domain-containing protein [Mobilitalea sp.]
MRKSILLSLYVFCIGIIFIACSTNSKNNSSDGDRIPDISLEENNPEGKSIEEAIVEKKNDAEGNENKDGNTDKEENANIVENTEEEDNNRFISPGENTLAGRINPPENYERVQAEENSFATYMRNLTLKKNGSPVLLYNGDEKSNQSAHIAVFDMEIGDKDLQQCADSLIRLYAEYYWSIGEYDKIAFHLTNNFLMEYVKWREGYRLSVSGNDTSWIKTAEYDDTYENLLAYLEIVFIYAGTMSLNSEGADINNEEILPGDMFIEGGSPGHCVLVIDMVENKKGEKAYLLAQGYMPAQEFHVLINPLHEEDPWYYETEITYPLNTPQWTFEENSLKRWLQ